MGLGDELMASGLARGARGRGKRAAFGDGKRIIWSPWSEQIFRHNPNIAHPGSEGAAGDLEWHHHYKGHRLYVKHHAERWYFDRSWRVTPGEMFFSDAETAFAERVEPGFVLIESRVKRVYPNKQWDVKRYRAVAEILAQRGLRVAQFRHAGGVGISSLEQIETADFRLALAVLRRAALYIGPEGGLSHGAAAVGIPAVVIFGGFPDPQVTGYPHHANLTGGVQPCGSIRPCYHCRVAMSNITVDQVVTEAMKHSARGARE